MTAAERPPLTDDQPAPGRFVRCVQPRHRQTAIYHGLYLPSDWRPAGRWPVIVEYAPNYAPAFGTTGRVDDCRLGYFLSGGCGYLWLVLPFVDTDRGCNADNWWGNLTATVDYCRVTVPVVCSEFGGDPARVFLTGFSRGAIACGFVGLHDDDIAELWCGFLPHSHIDGGCFTEKGSRSRLARTRGRPTFITYGSDDNGRPESLKGAAVLREFGFPVVERELAGVGHTDTWIETDHPVRREMRDWLTTVPDRPAA